MISVSVTYSPRPFTFAFRCGPRGTGRSFCRRFLGTTRRGGHVDSLCFGRLTEGGAIPYVVVTDFYTGGAEISFPPKIYGTLKDPFRQIRPYSQRMGTLSFSDHALV